MSRPARLPADDDLFRPTITNVPLPVPAPYRVSSLFFVGVFGGPFASSFVALVNARRLGASPQVRRLVLAAGLLSVALMLAAVRTGVQAATDFAVVVPGLLASFAQTRLLLERERYWSGRRVHASSQARIGVVAVIGGFLLANAAINAAGAL